MAAERCSYRFVLALVALLAGLLVATEIQGGSVDTNEPFTLVTGKLVGKGDAEALFIFDHEEPKLVIYLIEGETLKLLFVRNCKKDFEMKASLGKQDPPPSVVKKAVRRKKATGGSQKKEEKGDEKGQAKPVSKPETQTVQPLTGKYTLALGRPQGFGDADAIYIWSHDHKRLNVYLIRNDTLELLFSRNCTYDFELEKAGKMKPKDDLKTVARKED